MRRMMKVFTSRVLTSTEFYRQNINESYRHGRTATSRRVARVAWYAATHVFL